jgi:hypothetical protein
MRLAALAMLLVMGCGKAPVAVDLSPRVEIALASQDYPAGDNVPAVLTNRSPFPIYVTRDCVPGLEVSSGGVWTSVRMIVICTQDVRPPEEIAPGASIVRIIVTRMATDENLQPGTYRGLFRVSGPEGSFMPRYTPEFRLR